MSKATYEATLNYAKKFSQYKDFYIKHNDLIFSKLGLGTFSPEPYKEENYLFHYIESVKEAIKSGINLIDTASNYRYGQSEKEIGVALKELGNELKREELIICSKGGFIQLDYPFPKNPYEWIETNILEIFRLFNVPALLPNSCLRASLQCQWCLKSSPPSPMDSLCPKPHAP